MLASGQDSVVVRVMLAARLYHRGKTTHLVATGASMTERGLDPLGGAEAMAMIWRDLGIPASAVTKVGGRNTAEEIREIKKLLQRRPTNRAGLLTSAWHLPRALRLARDQQMAVVPVPADFETQKQTPLALALVPTATGFQKTERAIKEYLAYLVNR